MQFKKGLVAATLSLTLLVPVMAQAAGLTQQQIDSIVALLQSFGADTSTVSHVQAVLNGQTPHDNDMHQGGGMMGSTSWSGASTTPWGTPPGQGDKKACLMLSRNLGVGSVGDDVRKLQDMLAGDPDSNFHASSTGVFGPMTAEAMKRFQMHNGIASSTSGFVGAATRGFFERRCGKGLDGTHGGMMNGQNN